MRWVLPGGAKLGGGNNALDEQRVACRPGAAVLEPKRPPRRPGPIKRLLSALKRLPGRLTGSWSEEQLARVKLSLEILAVLVGLIGAVLALFGVSRK